MYARDFCKLLKGKTIEDVFVGNGVTIMVEGRKYHFVSFEGETEGGSRYRETLVYIDGKFALRT